MKHLSREQLANAGVKGEAELWIFNSEAQIFTPVVINLEEEKANLGGAQYHIRPFLKGRII